MVGRVRVTLTLALSVVLAACVPGAAPSASPSASGPVAVQVTDKTLGELQTVLLAQRDALVKRDLKAYQATFDGQRSAFRRCMQDTFDLAGRQGVGSVPPKIIKVEPYGGIYARAWVDEGSNGISRYYFRKVDGQWVRTEPTTDELGPEKVVTVEGIDIDHWAIDDDVVDALSKGTVAARGIVAQNQLSETKRLFGIRFYPTRGAATLVDCFIVGFHIANAANDDKFVRFFRYWFSPDLKSVSPTTIQFITHEALHWAQDDFIPGISARLDWWLTEGWPDYVGQNTSAASKTRAVCQTQIPTLDRLIDALRVFDREQTPVEEQVRYYAFANSMIEYLYAQFGGANAYKQLLTAYKESVDPKVTYPKALKVTPDEFYAGWVAFAKKKYC